MEAVARAAEAPTRRLGAAGVLGVVLGLVVAATAGSAGAEPAASADPGAGPRVALNADRAQFGQELEVTGSGFEAGELVDVKLCGVPDEKGVLACAPGIPGVQVSPTGVVNATLEVAEPPGDCPCAVVVDALGAPPVLSRIELAGHRSARKAVAPELVVDSAEITGGSALGFGGSAALRLEVRNAGVSPAQATLELSLRQGDDEPQPVTDPELPEIAPGTSRTVTVPLELGGFAQGTYAVSGNAVVGDLYAPVEASRALVPWGLYGIVALALLVGAAYRVRLLSRGDSPGAEQAADGVDSAPRPAPRVRRMAVTRSRPPRVPRPARTAAPARDEADAAAGARRDARDDVRDDTDTVPRGVPVQASAPVEPMIGPPRLASTPLARLAHAAATAPAAPAEPGEPGDEEATPTPDPVRAVPSGAYALPESLPGGPLPQAPPAPLVLPTQPAQSRIPGPRAQPRAAGVQGDEAIVARALASIKEHASGGPVRLPSRDEVALPTQRDRRAPKGGKRAKR